MTKGQRKKLYKLLEEWTRFEIAARHGPLGWTQWGDCFFEKLEREKKIRKLMFGTDDLLELGRIWKIKGCYTESKKKKRKKKG